MGTDAGAAGALRGAEAYELVFKGGVSCYSRVALEIQPGYSLQRDAKAVCADLPACTIRLYDLAGRKFLCVSILARLCTILFFRSQKPDYLPNACRIHGSLNLNKVAGNFHITAGKSLSLPQGHIHISAFMTDRDYNFTHRINRFSFGGPSPGIVHPLEGDEKIADNSKFPSIGRTLGRTISPVK